MSIHPLAFIKKMLLRIEIVTGLAWSRFLSLHVPFRRWRHLLGPIDGAPLAAEAAVREVSAERQRHALNIGHWIERLAGKMPFTAECLPQAMTARWVLARRGIPSRIIIGSRRGGEGEEPLLFHAWLKVGDAVVTGRTERDAFSAFSRGGKLPDAG